MNIDYTEIIGAIITVLSAVVTTFLIPYLKERLSQEKLQKLSYWVKIACQAAEQLYGSKTGQQKKEYVVAFLLSKGIVFDVDEVTALIESEVYKLTEKAKESAT